ncbi:hypothetical protein [Brumimicrobium oceani]|uniref:Lipocalin-like domain-containing protein n=1 Tax=Brumimicrobium oceani TaxID=2100725 RepID=A0A2U2XE86_9FLAO|nr:hypothetical protein [Brumimicrobium oceani]PWH86050.1 hypothetical protein DIT68_05700 [Brumimicrobium oceani]
MRFLILILVGLTFSSCQEQVDSSSEKKIDEILTKGNWKLVNSEQPYKRFQSGLKFSEDKQVFDVDSQGQVVVLMHPRLYTISGDTLTLVDYRYEERFLYKRGTANFLIEELNEERIVLEVLAPEEPNKLIFENLN